MAEKRRPKVAVATEAEFPSEKKKVFGYFKFKMNH